MSKRLNEKLIDIETEGLYPFHMPGHKRNMRKIQYENDFGEYLENAYSIDITEIDGFDNLHDAKDLIADAEKRAAKLYGSEETHFLVNGSTCGILSSIAAVCERGDKIIVARNCHISVYNAIELNGLKPVYVEPEIVAKESVLEGIQGSISVASIEKAVLSNGDAKAIFITSPTYDGVLSDVAGISRIAHEYDIPLIVDEAHGALFYLEGRSAVQNNADIVINSVHKTLPSLTQTAVIHINGNIVNREKVRKYLRIYQTSSPSYVLMGSIDYAVSVMEKEGNRLYREFCIRTSRLKETLSRLRCLKYIKKDSLLLEGVFDFDESKVLIAASGNTSGKDIYNILRNKYSLQPEMAAGDYVLLMTTLFDSEEGIERLEKALVEIDDLLNTKNSDFYEEINSYRDNDDSKNEYKERLNYLKEKTGKASPYTVFAYPPGIPVIVENEIVTDEVIEKIEKALNSDLDIKWIS